MALRRSDRMDNLVAAVKPRTPREELVEAMNINFLQELKKEVKAEIGIFSEEKLMEHCQSLQPIIYRTLDTKVQYQLNDPENLLPSVTERLEKIKLGLKISMAKAVVTELTNHEPTQQEVLKQLGNQLRYCQKKSPAFTRVLHTLPSNGYFKPSKKKADSVWSLIETQQQKIKETRAQLATLKKYVDQSHLTLMRLFAPAETTPLTKSSPAELPERVFCKR